MINLEGAKDPDDLIKQDPTLWERAISQHQPALEWLIDQYASRVDITTAAGKRELTTQAFGILAKINDPIEREHYVRYIAGKTEISETALNDRLEQFESPDTKRLKPVKVEPTSAKDPYAYQDYLLALMMSDTAVQDVVKKVNEDDIAGEERKKLFNYLCEHPAGIKDDVPEPLKDIETYVKIVLFKAETRYAGLTGQDRLVEAVNLVRQIKEQKRKQTKSELIHQLREAEANHESETVMKLRDEINYLIKEEARARKR